MRIGLIDVDGHNFPNLALMKISAYHKRKGDIVEFVNHWDSYDIVYKSKVFTNSPEQETVVNCDQLIEGGSGYNLTSKLLDEMEHMTPDYSLYPRYQYALGFLTRGCPRGCPFCIVKEKEGNARKVADLNEFWYGQKEIKLLDPNLLAAKESVSLLNQLAESKALVDFTQGLDVRLTDENIIKLLMKIRIKRIHFAYDMMKNSDLIERNLADVSRLTKWGRGKISVYILVNFNTTIEEDLHRIYFCNSLDFSPYVMVYDKNKLPPQSIYHRMQRWCNRPEIFQTTKFEEYKR